MVDKRFIGIKENPADIVKSTIKRLKGADKNEAARKLSICKKCPSRVPDKIFGGFMCEECFCPLKNLVHSEKGCDLNKW